MISRCLKRAGIPHMGGACGLPMSYKGLFTHITKVLNLDDTDPEERKVAQAISPTSWWSSARCPSARRTPPRGT